MIAARDHAHGVPGSCCQFNGEIAANCASAVNAEFHAL
jgi:hypothetical protein